MRNYFNRDINPFNIMVSNIDDSQSESESNLKLTLIDFNVARSITSKHEHGGAVKVLMKTNTGN